MNMEKDNTKQAYEKPVLRMIELYAEEIMGKCKMSGVTPGPGKKLCATCSNQFGGS